MASFAQVASCLSHARLPIPCLGRPLGTQERVAVFSLTGPTHTHDALFDTPDVCMFWKRVEGLTSVIFQPTTNVSLRHLQWLPGEDDLPRLICEICFTESCVRCGASPFHHGLSCEEEARRSTLLMEGYQRQTLRLQLGRPGLKPIGSGTRHCLSCESFAGCCYAGFDSQEGPVTLSCWCRVKDQAKGL